MHLAFDILSLDILSTLLVYYSIPSLDIPQYNPTERAQKEAFGYRCWRVEVLRGQGVRVPTHHPRSLARKEW